jgi:hypothetical protein
MYVDSLVGEYTIESDVVPVTSSDLSNQFLQGKIDIVRPLIKGQIKTKGRTGKPLKPVSSIEPVFQIYPRLLKEKGWNHLLV